MLPGAVQIFLFTLYTKKGWAKRNERERERSKEKETEIRSEVHVPVFLAELLYTIISIQPSLPASYTRTNTQTHDSHTYT